jgi:hypothetical protein
MAGDQPLGAANDIQIRASVSPELFTKMRASLDFIPSKKIIFSFLVSLASCARTDGGLDLSMACSSSSYIDFSPYHELYACSVDVGGSACTASKIEKKTDAAAKDEKCNIDFVTIDFENTGMCHVEVLLKEGEKYSVDIEIKEMKSLSSGAKVLCASPSDILVDMK